MLLRIKKSLLFLYLVLKHISSIIIKLYFPAIIAIHFSCLLAFLEENWSNKKKLLLFLWQLLTIHATRRQRVTESSFLRKAGAEGKKMIFLCFRSLHYKIKLVAFKCRNCSVVAKERTNEQRKATDNTFVFSFLLKIKTKRREEVKLHEDKCTR